MDATTQALGMVGNAPYDPHAAAMAIYNRNQANTTHQQNFYGVPGADGQVQLMPETEQAPDQYGLSGGDQVGRYQQWRNQQGQAAQQQLSDLRAHMPTDPSQYGNWGNQIEQQSALVRQYMLPQIDNGDKGAAWDAGFNAWKTAHPEMLNGQLDQAQAASGAYNGPNGANYIPLSQQQPQAPAAPPAPQAPAPQRTMNNYSPAPTPAASAPAGNGGIAPTSPGTGGTASAGQFAGFSGGAGSPPPYQNNNFPSQGGGQYAPTKPVSPGGGGQFGDYRMGA